ncbi:hypothetical protein J2S49_000984 [Arcanobacterium wilhelmae]|uniref:Uncharacterized protein n=1 Tax=Arcanobacterium wilhelmae TaxID=1803177 RepID=A0ABT9NB24_9ACTO|nr:hypothetical protein [Arcanobacterium wilhelmae]
MTFVWSCALRPTRLFHTLGIGTRYCVCISWPVRGGVSRETFQLKCRHAEAQRRTWIALRCMFIDDEMAREECASPSKNSIRREHSRGRKRLGVRRRRLLSQCASCFSTGNMTAWFELKGLPASIRRSHLTKNTGRNYRVQSTTPNISLAGLLTVSTSNRGTEYSRFKHVPDAAKELAVMH